MDTTARWKHGSWTRWKHGSWTHRPTFQFLRHYVEMVLAMYVGMLGLGAVFAVVLFAFGTTVHDARYDVPVLFALVMCFNMTVPMAFWMRHRGHPTNRITEMVGAMVAPAAVAIALFWSGLVGAGAVCPIECTAMLGAMLGVMLLRVSEYSHPRRSAPTR